MYYSFQLIEFPIPQKLLIHLKFLKHFVQTHLNYFQTQIIHIQDNIICHNQYKNLILYSQNSKSMYNLLNLIPLNQHH